MTTENINISAQQITVFRDQLVEIERMVQAWMQEAMAHQTTGPDGIHLMSTLLLMTKTVFGALSAEVNMRTLHSHGGQPSKKFH